MNVVTLSNVKTVGSKHESLDVKTKGVYKNVEPKTIRNNFGSPIIKDWSSDDESDVDVIPKVETVRPSTKEIKYVKHCRETVEKETNVIFLDMKIMMVDLFPLEMVKVEFLVKNNVLFTDTECLVLSSDFKLPNESQVMLTVPRKDNIYSVNLKNVVPTKGLTCLFAKATIDDTILWHRRLVKLQKSVEPEQEYILIPFCTTNQLSSQGSKDCEDDVGLKPTEVDESVVLNRDDKVANDAGKKSNENLENKCDKNDQTLRDESVKLIVQERAVEINTNITNSVTAASSSVNAAQPMNDTSLPNDPLMPNLEDIGIFDDAYDDQDVGVETDFNNLDKHMIVSPIPSTRIHKDHPVSQIIRDLQPAPQTRRMTKQFEEHALIGPMDMKCVLYMGSLMKKFMFQTLGFDGSEFPDKFNRGTIDKTLFIKRVKSDILLVQVYVDDIIFGSTNKKLCTDFEKLMHKKFQMSSMGERTFFLGLQVSQQEDGIFIHQDKYVDEILKKFGFSNVKIATTPMDTSKPLLKDAEAADVDVHLYRSMIGSLMYLTASRPDIMFVVCACARFQVTPKVSHLQAVKRIFKYLKGQPKLGLWYPKDSPFDLEAYTDSDYAGASLDRKSTTGGCQFLGRRLVSWQCKKQTIVANSSTEAEYVAAANCCGQIEIFVRIKFDDGNTLWKEIEVNAAWPTITTVSVS
ncbi:putative ribonuclease H-like domain-containing protein [Tanacetum coccineum]|uniref:Ribonuclease H-like domain-containing protein n=1 Tax=Tanacetum coccineum TaxID=301880 RepID=A0ABQ5CI46_9ASTR